MHELVIALNSKLSFVYLVIPIVAILTARRFDSFVLTSWIIAVFFGYINQTSLEVLLQGAAFEGSNEETYQLFIHYGTIGLFYMLGVVCVRYGHMLLKERVGSLAVLYMFSLLFMIVMQIVVYVDVAVFGKTELVSFVYELGISITHIVIAIFMIWHLLKSLVRGEFRWGSS